MFETTNQMSTVGALWAGQWWDQRNHGWMAGCNGRCNPLREQNNSQKTTGRESPFTCIYIYIRYVSENGTHILTSPATLNLQLLPQVSVRESSDHWFFSINSRKWAWKSIKWTLSNIHSRNPLVPPNESLIGFFSTQWVPSGNLT